MADKDFEPTDPLEPVAVAIATPGYDGTDAMARCFVEEFALMGWPAERIFKLFTLPTFAASHAVYCERGPDYVHRLIADVFGHEYREATDGAGI